MLYVYIMMSFYFLWFAEKGNFNPGHHYAVHVRSAAENESAEWSPSSGHSRSFQCPCVLSKLFFYLSRGDGI